MEINFQFKQQQKQNEKDSKWSFDSYQCCFINLFGHKRKTF